MVTDKEKDVTDFIKSPDVDRGSILFRIRSWLITSLIGKSVVIANVHVLGDIDLKTQDSVIIVDCQVTRGLTRIYNKDTKDTPEEFSDRCLEILRLAGDMPVLMNTLVDGDVEFEPGPGLIAHNVITGEQGKVAVRGLYGWSLDG